MLLVQMSISLRPLERLLELAHARIDCRFILHLLCYFIVQSPLLAFVLQLNSDRHVVQVLPGLLIVSHISGYVHHLALKVLGLVGGSRCWKEQRV